MRCEKYEKWILESESDQITQELNEHIINCSDCSKYYETEKQLNALIIKVKEEDVDSVTPLYLQKQKIEEKLDKRSLFRLPARKYQAGFAAAVVTALLIFTIIPFNYNKTIGYDLTLKGINEEIARDSDSICELLMSLELFEAGVDLGECNQTCNLVIFDLKNEKEVQTVITAFEQINHEKVKTTVEPINIKRTGTLFNRTNDVI